MGIVDGDVMKFLKRRFRGDEKLRFGGERSLGVSEMERVRALRNGCQEEGSNGFEEEEKEENMR